MAVSLFRNGQLTSARAAKLALAEKSPRDAPTLALRVVRDRADFADSYADAIGVKLTIPLSWGARVRQDIDSNRALLAQAEADYQQTLRRTHTAGETGRRALASSQRQLELAQRRYNAHCNREEHTQRDSAADQDNDAQHLDHSGLRSISCTCEPAVSTSRQGGDALG